MFDYKLDPKKIEKKLRLFEGLYNFVFQVKSHQLSKKNPNLNQDEILKLVHQSLRKGSA